MVAYHQSSNASLATPHSQKFPKTKPLRETPGPAHVQPEKNYCL